MTSILRKLMTAIAVLVVGGSILGGTMALAGGSATPLASTASGSSAERLRVGTPTPSASVGSDDDDGTPDQGSGDFPFEGEVGSD